LLTLPTKVCAWVLDRSDALMSRRRRGYACSARALLFNAHLPLYLAGLRQNVKIKEEMKERNQTDALFCLEHQFSIYSDFDSSYAGV
jgi:hypothetical protein